MSEKHTQRADIQGGVTVAWMVKAGWQIEGISNYGPNVVSFVLTTGRWRWYVVGGYVLLNDAPTIVRVEQTLGREENGVEIKILGDLNVRLQEPLDAREEELATVLENSGLEEMTDHFRPKQQYQEYRD